MTISGRARPTSSASLRNDAGRSPRRSATSSANPAIGAPGPASPSARQSRRNFDSTSMVWRRMKAVVVPAASRCPSRAKKASMSRRASRAGSSPASSRRARCAEKTPTALSVVCTLTLPTEMSASAAHALAAAFSHPWVIGGDMARPLTCRALVPMNDSEPCLPQWRRSQTSLACSPSRSEQASATQRAVSDKKWRTAGVTAVTSISSTLLTCRRRKQSTLARS